MMFTIYLFLKDYDNLHILAIQIWMFTILKLLQYYIFFQNKSFSYFEINNFENNK